MTYGRCLWCEKKNTPIAADGLCGMCTDVGLTLDANFVSPAMKSAWADYDPPDGFDFDGGYNQCVALIRHAFLTGYAAAQGTEAQRATTVEQGVVHDGPVASWRCAQTPGGGGK